MEQHIIYREGTPEDRKKSKTKSEERKTIDFRVLFNSIKQKRGEPDENIHRYGKIR